MNKQQLRERIARDTREFLNNGGTIKVLDNSGRVVAEKTVDDSPVSRDALDSDSEDPDQLQAGMA